MKLCETTVSEPKVFLYHLTSADALEDIFDRGIDPVSYWGTLPVVRYYRSMKLHTGDPMIFRVPLDRFRPALLLPDMRGIQEPPSASVIDMTEDEVSEAWDESNQTWQDSLNLIGSVAYEATVPVTLRDVFRDPNR